MTCNDRNSSGLRGFARADRLVEIINLIIEHSNFDPARMDTIIKINLTILEIYTQHLIEDENAKIGLAYPDGVDDEHVRADAEEALGTPVDLHQVLLVRRFIGSLFTSGHVTEDDVRRIQRMFIGRFKGD
jgi:hypothetical protein